MKRTIGYAALVALAVTTGSGAVAGKDRIHRNATSNGTARTISYGPDRLQQLDFYAATSGQSSPLIVFVHGGGWKHGDKDMMRSSVKLADWRAKGYAVASVNYRLVPAFRVEDQAADVAHAVALLRKQATALGVDANRLVLVGHSAGAHLVALVGTDPQFLRAAGLSPGDVRGVISLDGAAYDVPAQMGENARLMGDTYREAFGTDPARQRALSPTFNAAAPNAPAFLLLHVQRPDGVRQSEELAAALRKAGTPVEIHGVEGRGLIGHMEINRRLGEPDYPATALVDTWLAKILAP